MNAPQVDAAASNAKLSSLVGLLRRAALELELSEQETQRVSEESRVTLAGVEVQLGLSIDEAALVLSAEVGPDTLDTAQRKRLALECALPLATTCGISIGCEFGQTVLTCRWPINEDGAGDLAAGVRELVGMTLALREYGVDVLVTAMAVI